MIALVAVLGVLLQPAQPGVSTTISRDRLRAGEELVFTVRAVSPSSEPMRVTVDPPAGFVVVSREEHAEVGSPTRPSRAVTLELRLRAVEPGTWSLGPVVAHQGDEVMEAPARLVEVLPGALGAPAHLATPLLQRLQQRPPPMRAGDVALEVLTLAESGYVGAPLELVTLAWFPRALREQLRRPPVLVPPAVTGVWAGPRSVGDGVALTRMVNRIPYDLFVSTQTVYPLREGTLVVPAAALRYAVPVALQFLGQEERYAIGSAPLAIRIDPLPAAGRPANFSGAVASSLQLRREVHPAVVEAGESAVLDVTLEGRGNGTLWPAPPLELPAGVRAYPDRTDELPQAPDDSLVRKRFRYLLVADRGGHLVLPGVSYPWFDPGARRYASADAPSLALSVAAVARTRVRDAAPEPLPADTAPPDAWLRVVPEWAWIVAWLLPPLVAMLRRGPARQRRRRASDTRRGLAEVASRWLGRRPTGSPAMVTRALVREGMEPALAAEVAREWEREAAGRFGPGARAAAASPELVRRVEQAWEASARRRRLGVLLLACVVAAPLAAAEPTPLATTFQRGVERYRAGDDAGAFAAWLRAAELSPRDAQVRLALQRVLPPGAPLPVPCTPRELLLAATLAWAAGWGVLRRGGHTISAVLLVVAAGGLLAGAVLLAEARSRPLAVTRTAVVMRGAPLALADSIGAVAGREEVELQRRLPGWALARLPDGRAGWVPDGALVPVGE